MTRDLFGAKLREKLSQLDEVKKLFTTEEGGKHNDRVNPLLFLRGVLFCQVILRRGTLWRKCATPVAIDYRAAPSSPAAWKQHPSFFPLSFLHWAHSTMLHSVPQREYI